MPQHRTEYIATPTVHATGEIDTIVAAFERMKHLIDGGTWPVIVHGQEYIFYKSWDREWTIRTAAEGGVAKKRKIKTRSREVVRVER